MSLHLTQQTVTVRRLGGLALSVSLHVATLTIAAYGIVSWRHVPRESKPEVEVTYVSLAPESAVRPEPMLVEQADLFTDFPADSASLSLPDFDFDVTKISTRRNVLFPFITADLSFLDALRRETALSQRRFVNPFQDPATSRTDSKPPFLVSTAALDRAVDRAWTRRDRWNKFSEMADVLQRSDPDHGRAAELVKAYRDRNILQPVCDYRIVTGPPRREQIIPDHLAWMMLENSADHADFVDFVHAFARRHPSSRATTELLFIIDKLVQGNRDALLELLSIKPGRDLALTSSVNRAAFDMIIAIQRHYATWLAEHGLDSVSAIKARYDDVRLRILSTIVETTPGGYRGGDAQFLMGELLFNQGKVTEAAKKWRAIAPDPSDSYASTYVEITNALRSSSEADTKTISRVLEKSQAARWFVSADRLRQFGSACDRF